MTKYGVFVLAIVIAATAWVSRAQATQIDPCEYSCPVVHVTWQAEECPVDLNAYTSTNNHKACSHHFNYGWRYADKVSVNHVADVAYEKSQDKTKCHRPSDSTLEHQYGMDHDARDDFKKANSEWKDAEIRCPEPTATPTPECTPTPEVTPTPEETPTPEVTPTPEETPTPEATPTEAPHQDNGGGPSFAPSSTLAHDPSCTVEFDAPKLQGYEKAADGSRVLHWWKSTDPGVDKQSLVYGFAAGDEQFGIVSIDKDATEVTVRDFPGSVLWAQVWAWKGQCVAKSVWFDP